MVTRIRVNFPLFFPSKKSLNKLGLQAKADRDGKLMQPKGKIKTRNNQSWTRTSTNYAVCVSQS